MKTFKERFPDRIPNNGYLAPCKRCGDIVIHARSTGAPFHMHRWSKKCADKAAARGKA